MVERIAPPDANEAATYNSSSSTPSARRVSEPDSSKLITSKELARKLGISNRSVERLRVAGNGPEYVRIGRLVRYRQADVERWLQANGQKSTSEYRLTAFGQKAAKVSPAEAF